MMEILQATLLAPIKYYNLYKYGRIALIIAIALCALVAIVSVLMQNGNSSGIDAINGSSETFYSKNKKRSKESTLKIVTAVSGICIAVLSLGFFLLELLV